MPRHRLVARAVVVVVVAACLFAAGRPRAQGRVPGAIRVQITLVPINVVVTDKDDRPVTDLKESDFSIIEDGVRQSIAHFSQTSLSAQPPDPSVPSKALLRQIAPAELTEENRRTFLIVLGRGRLQHPSKGIDGLLQFVRQGLLPQDLVAVLAYNRATDFTTDHEKIAQVLERFKKHHEGIEGKMALHFSGLAAIYASQEIPKGIQSDIAKIFDAPGGPGTRQLPPGQVSNEGRMRDDARDVVDTMQRAATAEAGGLSLGPLESLRADALTDLPFETYVSSNRATMQDLQNLYTAVSYLRYMEGEKHLLFFTENGLFLPRLEHDESLAAKANDARVTIDTFQTGGVASAPLFTAETSGFSASSRSPGGTGARTSAGPVQRPPSFSQAFALSSLRNISRLTGGRSSIHASVPDALAQLDRVTRSEYLLGYYPKNGDWNGKYRRLVVRVNRPDLKLYYRRGYFARQSLQPFDRKAFLSYSRISAAGAYEQEVKDIPLHVTVKAVPAGEGGGREVQVDVNIQVGKLPFGDENGRHAAALQVTTFYGDGRGRFLGESWQTVDLKLKDATWEKVKAEGLPFSTRVPLQAEGQTFKIVVYSYEADRVGSATARLK